MGKTGKSKDWAAGSSVSGTSVFGEEDDDDVEDYDTMGIDRSALVGKCKGGGVETREYNSSFAAGTVATGDRGDSSGFDGSSSNMKR